MGASFDYQTGYSARNTFTKKLLKYTVKHFTFENVLFLLMCEEFERFPSPSLFETIYDDFVRPSGNTNSFGYPGGAVVASTDALYQVNISTSQVQPIQMVHTAWLQGPVGGSLHDTRFISTDVFDEAVKEIRAVVRRDVVPRLMKDAFDTAFLLTTPAEKARFEQCIHYLSANGVVLV